MFSAYTLMCVECDQVALVHSQCSTDCFTASTVCDVLMTIVVSVRCNRDFLSYDGFSSSLTNITYGFYGKISIGT